MSTSDVIFDAAGLIVTADPGDGPRGGRLTFKPTVPDVAPRLLEGEAKQLHLAIRKWIRFQKALRGDTPRGRAKVEERRAQYSAAAKASPAAPR